MAGAITGQTTHGDNATISIGRSVAANRSRVVIDSWRHLLEYARNIDVLHGGSGSMLSSVIARTREPIKFVLRNKLHAGV